MASNFLSLVLHFPVLGRKSRLLQSSLLLTSYPSSNSSEGIPILGQSDSPDYLFPGDTCQLIQIKCLLVDTGYLKMTL